MKKIVTLLFLAITSFSYSQTSILENIKKDKSVTEISYTMQSTQELETINWDEIKAIFENNKDETVKLSVALEPKKAKYNFKSSFTVSGETKNLDSLIFRAKKGVKSLIKISEKYKN